MAAVTEAGGRTRVELLLPVAARSLKEIEDRLIEGVDENLFTRDEALPAFTLKKRCAAAVSKLTIYLRNKPDPPNFRPRPRKRRRKT